MPPMVIGPYGPREPTIGRLFFGTAIPISPMSPMPFAPIVM